MTRSNVVLLSDRRRTGGYTLSERDRADLFIPERFYATADDEFLFSASPPPSALEAARQRRSSPSSAAAPHYIRPIRAVGVERIIETVADLCAIGFVITVFYFGLLLAAALQ